MGDEAQSRKLAKIFLQVCPVLFCNAESETGKNFRIALSLIFRKSRETSKNFLSRIYNIRFACIENQQSDGLRFRRKREQAVCLRISWHLFCCQKFNEILAARSAYFNKNSCRCLHPHLAFLFFSKFLALKLFLSLCSLPVF